MSAREEFARDVFLADNSSALASVAEKDWHENREHHDYAFEIADQLIAKGYARASGESQIIRSIATSASKALDAISNLGSDDPAEGFQKVSGRGASRSTREP